MDWKLQNNEEKSRKKKMNETVLSKSVSWKPRKTSEEQAGMSNLSYKCEKKPGDW